MTHSQARLAVGMVAVGMIVSGCGSATTQAPVLARGTSTSSPTATVSPSAPGTPRPEGILTRALLRTGDLPAGWQVKPIHSSADPVFSSDDPGCTTLMAMDRGQDLPGTLTSAAVAFGPKAARGALVTEQIESMGSATNAVALITQFKAAEATCNVYTMTIPGSGQKVPITITLAAPPNSGTGTAAFNSDLFGVQVMEVLTSVDDTVILVTMPALLDVNAITAKAVQRAQAALTTGNV